MSKERLKELAYNVAATSDGRVIMSGDDYSFLYEYALEQTERVQELKMKVVDLEDRLKLMTYSQRFHKKNAEELSRISKQYRSTLEDNKAYLQKALTMVPSDGIPRVITVPLTMINKALKDKSRIEDEYINE